MPTFRRESKLAASPPKALPSEVPLCTLELTQEGSEPVFTIACWTPGAEKLTGLKSRSLLGTDLRQLLRPSAAEECLRQIQELSRARRTGSVELPLEASRTPIYATIWREDKALMLMMHPPVNGDALGHAFRELNNLLDRVTESFVHVDRSWKLTYLSPRAERLLRRFGVRYEVLEGTSLKEVLPQLGSLSTFELFQKAMKQRTSIEFEDYYQPLNTWFSVHGYPIGNGLAIYIRDITRQRLAEAAFMKLSNAVEQSADAVYITDTSGRIEYVNPAFERITGYPQAEAIGQTLHFLRSEESESDFYRDLWQTTNLGKTFQTTQLYQRRSGEFYFAEETISPVKDANGSLSHLVATLKDITERKRSEDAIRQSEERFRALVENSTDGIILLDAHRRVVYAGPSTSRILGYSSDELVGQELRNLVVPEDLPVVRSLLDSVLGEPHKTRTVQFRIRHQDDSWRWIEATANNLLNEPSIHSLVLNYRDVTDRKWIEEALSKSEAEYRSLFERANDAILIIDPDGTTILEANTRACDLYGYTKDDLVGRNFKELTKEPHRLDDQIRRLLRDQVGQNYESIHLTKAGSAREMLVNSAIVEYAGRQAVLSICRDITDMKKLETQLRQAQKMESVGTLAGGIAHDFNNILSIILGYTSLLKRGRIDQNKTTESLEAITKAAQRGSVLVRQILTFARKTEILFESVGLNDVIRDLGKLLSETFPKTVVFKLSLEENLPSVVADANQMHQVFLNLAVNARDAMPAGGTLTLKTESVGAEMVTSRFSDAPQTDFVHIAVSDTGLGMDETTKSRIFEPFFTTKGQGQGTGLGLAVVYGIVNSHKGFIEVESAPGTGTTFHLYFPVQMRRFEQPLLDDAKIEEAPGGNETILVAEDEKSLLDLVQGLLQSKGYRVIPASDGEEAMELYQEHRGEISLVLTDIGLPRLNGWEVCRRINQMDARTKIVVASGYLDPQAKSELGNSAARDFIHKPYLPDEVLTRIRGVLDAP
jgi:two-component system cell cycle sensor histidine kinase/response regulator CckA